MSKPSRGEPTFHPISLLSTVGAVIQGMLESAEEQARLLLEADQHPYALDDAKVARLLRVYSEQAADHWLFEEQLWRWSAGPLSAEQRQEVERLSLATARLKQVTTAILSMAETLKSQTIESLLGKSDAEVGLEYLLGTDPAPPGLRRSEGARRAGLPSDPPRLGTVPGGARGEHEGRAARGLPELDA